MAEEVTISRPAPFVEDIGKDLAKQAIAFTGVPVVSGGIGSLSQQTGETAEGFKARQDAARAFTTRQQNLAGLAPQVAQQDALQTQSYNLAGQGVGAYQPFLTQQAAYSGPQAYQNFTSPYQQDVIDATMSEFDKQTQAGLTGIGQKAAMSGNLGGGREGVMRANYMSDQDAN